MAKEVKYTDDFDKSPDARPIIWSLDGVEWQVDLSEKNIEKLDKLLTKYKVRKPESDTAAQSSEGGAKQERALTESQKALIAIQVHGKTLKDCTAWLVATNKRENGQRGPVSIDLKKMYIAHLDNEAKAK